MNSREVIPFAHPLNLALTLPGSKSITNRAFLCAALAEGKSVIKGALKSDDTQVMLKALGQLGIVCQETPEGDVMIEGRGGEFDSGDFMLDLHNAGTATRFLTALMALRKGETVITGDTRMQERPIGDLVEALKQLGAQIDYMKAPGFPPLKITSSVLQNFTVQMKGDKSSQYFSALLMLAPLLPETFHLEVVGDLVSKPYIDTTIAVMRAFGVRVQNTDYQSFTVQPQAYQACTFEVEGDASAASYFTSLQYLHGGELNFTNLNTKFVQNMNKKSIQGDSAYSSALNRLGTGKITMNSMPDSAMTLAVTAPFTEGITQITDVANLRIKETDRLAALEAELKTLGVNVETTTDSITVSGGISSPSNNVSIKTYNDHRMAMCFAVVGTKLPGILIENPECTDKTYPHFWEDLELAYLSPIELGDKNLVLTGMRGAGKSHLGKRIAAHLGRDFVDLDAEIEKEAGKTITALVESEGWEVFREIEHKICSAYAAASQLVIATGGGAILNAENMKHLKQNGVNVFIFADPQVLSERIAKKANRPSLTGQNPASELHRIWHERRDLYLKYADFVWDNTSGEVIRGNLERVFARH